MPDAIELSQGAFAHIVGEAAKGQLCRQLRFGEFSVELQIEIALPEVIDEVGTVSDDFALGEGVEHESLATSRKRVLAIEAGFPDGGRPGKDEIYSGRLLLIDILLYCQGEALDALGLIYYGGVSDRSDPEIGVGLGDFVGRAVSEGVVGEPQWLELFLRHAGFPDSSCALDDHDFLRGIQNGATERPRYVVHRASYA